MLGDASLSWNVDGNWNVDFQVSAGRSDSYVGQNHGTVNQSMVTLDLNGLEVVNVGQPVGTPQAVILEQLERFAAEVMPAFKSK